MSSKYSALPDIDTQPDVYETPDKTSEDADVSDDGYPRYPISEDANEDIVREELSSKAAEKFRKDVSNTDRISSRKFTEHSVLEILSRQEKSQETPQQKLIRLRYEIQELQELVEKEENPSLDQISDDDIVSEVAKLHIDLSRISQGLNSEEDGIIKQAELGKRLIHQLEAFKNIGLSKQDGIADDKKTTADDVEQKTNDVMGDEAAQAPSVNGAKNVVTYELYYSPETIKTHTLAKTAELDQRIAGLEKLLGTSHGQNFEDLSISITNTNLIATVDKLEQHMQLLTQTHNLESISRKAKTLASQLEKVNDLKNKELANGGVIPFETEEKIKYLFELLGKADPLMSVAPALVNRLKSLQQLHYEAALFNDTIKMLAEEQSKIDDELKSLNGVAVKLEESFKQNDETIRRNIEVVDERVTGLAQRLDKLLK